MWHFYPKNRNLVTPDGTNNPKNRDFETPEKCTLNSKNRDFEV